MARLSLQVRKDNIASKTLLTGGKGPGSPFRTSVGAEDFALVEYTEHAERFFA